MNQDFVTQLRLQLREAAQREERRAPFAQRLVRTRRGLPGPAPLAAALAVALLALAVAIGVLQLHDDSEPVKPKVIDTFKVSDALSSLAGGFGAGWAADPVRGEVLRIDPESREVTARVELGGGEVRVATGAGAVWALSGDLLTAGAQGGGGGRAHRPAHEPGRRADPGAVAGREELRPALPGGRPRPCLGPRRPGRDAHRPRDQRARPLRRLRARVPAARG